MIIKGMRQNHSEFEELVENKKRAAFRWPFMPSPEPVQPVESPPQDPEGGGLPPPPPGDENLPPPPKPSAGGMKNVASRMLAEGLDLPENVSNKPPTDGGDPLSSGSVGAHQSKTLAKRKNKDMNRPSSLGGMTV